MNLQTFRINRSKTATRDSRADSLTARKPASFQLPIRVAAAALCGLLACGAQAASTGWNLTSGTNDYNTAANWVGSSINGVFDPSLTFTGAQTVTFATDTTLTTGLTFNYTGNFGLTLDSSSSTLHTLTLGGDITVGMASNQTVTIGNATNVLNVNLGNAARTFTVNASKNLVFVNAISGTSGISIAGAGTTTFSGANTYSGATNINGGTLKLSGAAGSAAASNVAVNTGATLSFDSSTSGVTGATRAKSTTLNGGNLTVTGNATANSSDTIANALTIGGGASTATVTSNAAKNAQLDAASFARNAGGSVLFRGTNLGVNAIGTGTNSSNIVFSTGPTLSGTGAAGTTTAGIIAGAYGDTTAAGTGFGATGGLVTYDSTNGVRLLNTATEYTSAITSGQSQLDNVRYVNTSGAGVVTTTLGSGTTNINSLSFNITGTGTNSGVTINGSGVLKINSGVVYAYQGVTTATASDAMLITGTSGGSGGLTLDFNGKEASFIVSTNGISNATTAAPLEIDSAITNAQGLTKAGSGILKLSGTAANTYSGVTTVNAGYLSLGKSVSNVAIPGDLVLNAGAVMDGGNQFADTSNVTINGGTLYFAGSSNTGSATSETMGGLTINGGQTSNAAGHSNSLTINGNTALNGGSLNGSSGETFTFGGALTLSGGTFNIARANSTSGAYDSNANINGGLVINNTTSGTYTPISIASGTGGGTNNGGRMILNSDVTFNGNATNTNTATINAASGAAPGTIVLIGTRTFNIGDGAAANDLTVNAGMINNSLSSMPGALVKTGAGTLALSASNAYSGITSINAGTLSLWNTSALAGGGNVTFGGGTLQYSGSNTVDYSGVIANSGSAIAIDTNGQGVTYNSALAGSNTGGLNKLGLGTLTLAGANAYTGTTTVSAGTLQLNAAGTLGNSGNTLNMNGGVLDLAGINAGVGNLSGTAGTVLNNTSSTTATLTIGNNNSAGGNYSAQLADHSTGTGILALTKVGSGTATISGSNSYTGATTVNGGVLKLGGAAGSVGSSDITANPGTTVTLDSSASGVTGTTRAKSITLDSATLSVTGNATANSADTITNALGIGAGASTVTVTGNTATNWQLDSGSFNRSAGGVALFRGTNLGVNAIGTGTNSSNVVFNSTSGLLSGTGAVGTTTVGIIAGAYGDTTSAGTGFGATGGLVTYDSAYGVRLLNTATEYTAAITDGQTQLDNVRYVNTSGAGVVTTTLTSATTSINSLSFNVTGGGTNSGVTVTGNAGTTLKLNSGVIYAYQKVTAPAASDIQIISVPTLDLNGNEGVIIASNAAQSGANGAENAPLEIDSAITNDGGHGITKAGSGELKIGGTAQSTYTGNTVVDAGELYLAKSTSNTALSNGSTLVINSGLVLQNSNQIPDSSSVNVNGGTWEISTSTSNGNHSSETINNLTMTSGAARNGASNGGTLNILGSAVISGGAFSAVGQGSNVTVTGSLAISNGGTVSLGRSSTSGTSYDSTLTVNGGLAITNTATGAYTPLSISSGTGGTNNGGKLVLASDLTFTGNSTNTNTTIISGTGAGLSGVMALSGTRTFTIGDGAATVDLTISAAMMNGTTTGALIKSGAGTLSLTGSNSYTGGTTISTGELLVMNTLNGTVTISGGAILGGIGTETGLVTASGATSVFAPGDINSIGTMDLSGGVSAASGATFNYNINGDGIDTIDFGSGSVTLGGTVSVNFTSLGPVNLGQPYNLFAGSGSWSGSPAFVFNPPAGLHLDTSYGSGSGYIWDTVNHSFSVQFANNNWYLTTSETGTQDWGNGFLTYWNSQPDGSGTAPTAINSYDNYIDGTSGYQVRTPVLTSTFGGNSLSLNSGATLSVMTYTGERSTIPYLITSKGTISGSPNASYTQPVTISDFVNQSGTTTLSTGAGKGLELDITSLTGTGSISMATGGAYYLNVSQAYNYLGSVNLTGGSLSFLNAISTGGALLISGSTPQVALTQPVIFRAMTINSSTYAPGTYSYATLSAAYPAIFTSGSSGGSITVQGPQNWYLTADQGSSEDWTQTYVGDWNSNPAGGGTVATSINLVDNYINNVGTNDLRTPSVNSTFGGGSLTLGGSAILDLQTGNGATTMIPNFITTGGTVAGLAGSYTQYLFTGSYVGSSGTTTYTSPAGSGINLSATTLSGSGGISLSGGGNFVLNFADPSGYAGNITLASGSLDVEVPASGIPFFTLGGLTVNSGATVTLNNWAYFTALTVNGVVKTTGTYTASSLGFSGTGKLVVYTRDVSGPPQMFGVNLSAAEGGTVPGTYGFDYTYPTDAEMAYYQGKGLTLIRLPFRWERIQHTLNGTLDSAELGHMDAVVGYARNRGMKVILDMHNYFSCQVSGTSYKIGTTQVPYSAYQNVWSQLATHYASETAVYGYDIMNEPVTAIGNWSIAAQDAVDTIRQCDTTHYIFCEGVSYSGAQSWLSANKTLNILDPVGRLIYSAHSYWDSNHDGVYGSYASEGGDPNMAVNYVAPFITWLQSKPGAHGHIGEYGVPYATDSASWNTVLDNFMSDIKTNGLSGTYWAGGPWLGTYQLNCEPVPITSGTDKPQMSVLQNYHQ